MTITIRNSTSVPEILMPSSMSTFEQLFTGRLFQIPDYQRGYSWKSDELDDFWQDVLNLRSDRSHYTGTITLEKFPENIRNSSYDDVIYLSKQGYTKYFIVDGQQRVTTIIIVLKSLLDLMEDDQSYNGLAKAEIISKYFYQQNPSDGQPCYVFGYAKDDPSNEYLKREIYNQTSLTRGQPETSYTNNLGVCYKFFQKKLSLLNRAERGVVFKKVTQQLKFDVKLISDELDIFVVFETMNNRGKQLSNLEKLKNRLIYLSTLIPNLKSGGRTRLREDINTLALRYKSKSVNWLSFCSLKYCN